LQVRLEVFNLLNWANFATPIILQSEGAEVFYRDIEIRSITAIPPEFRAQ